MAELSRGIKTSMKIEGLEELRKALRLLPEELQKKSLGDAVAKGASVIRDEAKRLAPVLKEPSKHRTPGLLRRMIRSTRGVRNGSEAAAFVSVRRLVKKALAKAKAKTKKSGAELDPFYWAFIEFGTSKRKAHPFLRPAFDTQKEKAAEQIKQALAEGLAKAAAKVRGRRF